MVTAPEYESAVALITHVAARDEDGIDCILTEIGENATPFFAALIDAYTMLVDRYCDPAVRAGLLALLGYHAAAGPRPYHDAAVAVFAYAQSTCTGDPEPFNAALCDGDPPPAPLAVIYAITDMFGHAMPQLGTDDGLGRLREWCAGLLATDDDDPSGE
jgi:hypothetical protein